MKDLYKHVTPCYAAQWEDIGVYLDIELGHLNTIRANHPGDVGGCCKDLWKKWLELDPDATWDKLFTAIDDCAATSASTSTSTYHKYRNVTNYVVSCDPTISQHLGHTRKIDCFSFPVWMQVIFLQSSTRLIFKQPF